MEQLAGWATSFTPGVSIDGDQGLLLEILKKHFIYIFIAAVLLVANNATYTDAANNNAYYNKYGGRDVGIVAAQFDEFFFTGSLRKLPITLFQKLYQ